MATGEEKMQNNNNNNNNNANLKTLIIYVLPQNHHWEQGL